MSTLLDTNLLIRLAQPHHPMHQAAVDAISALHGRAEQLWLVPQNFYEFWVVATRPTAQNGLGFTPAQAQTELSRLKNLFGLRDDTPAILPEWERLVAAYQVSGKNGHDARLVAAMIVHGIGQLLTFNKPDFQRYQGITVLSPQDVLSSPAPP
jgi:predicted nucleic acid-binding protein